MTDEKSNGVNLGFEDRLWEMAVKGKVRGCEDTAERKHIALGLVFSLARLRDTSLPELVSGELRIIDAEMLLDRPSISGVCNGQS